MGKYSNVLRRYGKAGFGVPSKAPHTGSFPLYPSSRAQYALTIIASPVYDTKRRLRAQVAKRAIEAHPELDSYWNDLQKDTIKPRMRRGTKKAANPRRGSMPRSPRKSKRSGGVFRLAKQVDQIVLWNDDDGLHAAKFRAPLGSRMAIRTAEKKIKEHYGVKEAKLLLAQDLGGGNLVFEAYTDPSRASLGFYGAWHWPGQGLRQRSSRTSSE